MQGLVGGRFELVDRVGTGGMGTVWRALDHVTGAQVAVKVLRDGLRDAARFSREADVLARLSHPNIVAHIDHGVDPGGAPYLAMEWIDGRTLTTRLRDQGLDLSETLQVLRPVTAALAEVHRHGLVHRDVKPDNLVFPGDRLDEVKLIDFGVARNAEELAHLTRTGFAVGTPGYMAPEQARGVRELDARTDVFALGCVLYECLTGVAPFRGEHAMAIQARILLEDPAPLEAFCPEAPAPLRDLTSRMLVKDPTGRPADAGQVAAELAALTDLPAGARRPRRNRARTAETIDLRKQSPLVEQAGMQPLPPDPITDQPILSLVIGSPTVSHLSRADTLAPEELDAWASELTRVAAAHGARAALLADGTLIAALKGEGYPEAHARRAARLALELRQALRDVPMVIVTGTPEIGDTQANGIFDRGARSFAAASAFARMAPPGSSGIMLDPTTAGLLGDSHVVSAGKLGHYLKG